MFVALLKKIIERLKQLAEGAKPEGWIKSRLNAERVGKHKQVTGKLMW